jgi:glycosyltransferase involved in cell wall biosynthesis
LITYTLRRYGIELSIARKISVIVPAHNEERFIEGCLQAIHVASTNIDIPVEVVVVLNRCSDKTQEIAQRYDAVCIPDDSRCIATIRNKGVAAATGDVIVTCDADSRLHPMALIGVATKLADNAIIGGGMRITFDRRAPGIIFTEIFFDIMTLFTGLPCGAFWTTKESFLAAGGFNERLPMGEDIDLAKRLRQLGKQRGQRYIILDNAPLLTSSRKFDYFGDTLFFKMVFKEAFRIRRSIKGIDTEFVDEYFYNFNDKK